MASLDASLNIAGSSLQLTSFLLGGLALPLAKPIRTWFKEHANWVAVTLVMGAVGLARLGADLTIPDNLLTGIIFAAVFGPLLGLSILSVRWLADWLSDAPDAALTNVLRVMVIFFGLGIVFNLVAAVTE